MNSDFLHATDQAAKSLKWTSLIEILSRTATPIVFLALATLLAPSDFGLLAAATIVVSFTQIFVDSGLGRALIQHATDRIEAVANTTFWINVALSMVLYGLLFLTAPLIAAAFEQEALVNIVRVLGFQVILASLATVQQSLLQRNFAFKRILLTKLASAFIPGLVSIFLAWEGYGVWSLVFGALTMSVINSAALWLACSWKPTFAFDWHALAPILGFGSWTLLEGLATWFLLWGDNFIVGSFLGVEELGIYRVASSIALVVFTIALNPFISVLYPYLSRLQDNTDAVRDIFAKLNRLVTALALPLGIGLALVAPTTMPVIFGERWAGLGFVLSVLAVREGVSWLAGVNPELYRSIGRPDINVKVILITICIYLPAYLFSAPYGLRAFSLARVIATAIGLAVHVLFTSRLLGIRKMYLFNSAKTVAAACAAMAVAVVGAQGLLSTMAGPIVSTAAVTLIGITVYVAVLRKIDAQLMSLAARLWSRASG